MPVHFALGRPEPRGCFLRKRHARLAALGSFVIIEASKILVSLEIYSSKDYIILIDGVCRP